MTSSNTPRRILQDLPVNAFGTPSASILQTSSSVSLKRQFHEVEDPSLPPTPLRSRLTDYNPRLGPNTTGETQLEIAYQRASHAAWHEDEDADEMIEQSTSKGTRSESVYSDMEGDTMDTQQTEATEMSLQTGLTTLSRAETLRLRLRVALFKVQTDQTNIPVSQLRIPVAQSHESNPSAEPSTRHAIVQPPRLLPAPVLKPAVRSNPWSQSSQMLSSPPITRAGSPTKASDGNIFRTPCLPLSKVRLSPQLSSPPNSQDGGSKVIEVEDSHLNSSAVKGDAAISLLGLRDVRR